MTRYVLAAREAARTNNIPILDVEITPEPPAEALAQYRLPIYWRTRVFNPSSDSYEERVLAADVPARRLGPGRYRLLPLALGALLRALTAAGDEVELKGPPWLLASLSAWQKRWTPTGGLPHAPRPYQQEAAKTAAGNHFTLVELPTGAGKTYVAALLLRTLRLPALVLEPTLDLVDQTVARLRAAGIPACPGGEACQVEVTTYQAASRRRPGERKAVLVLDEAHHVPASTWRRPLLANPWHTVLALTATAQRSDGNTDVLDKLAARYRRSYGELAAEGYLAPVVFTIAPVDDPAAAAALEDLAATSRSWQHFRTRAAARWEDAAAEAAATIAAEEASAGRKVILFSDYVRVVEKMADEARRRGAPAVVLHGSLSKEKRRRNLEAFRAGEARILAASPAGNEGLDIPDADTVVLLSLPNTLRLRQRVGRATRPAPGKTARVYILSLLHRPRHPYVWRLGVVHERVLARARKEALYYNAPVEVSKPWRR